MALYTPGQEPEKLQKKLRTFFRRIDEIYPDKQIISLHQNHKHLGERATALYRALGYASAQEMAEAYGYTYVRKVRSKSKSVQQRRQNAAAHVLAALSKRYPEGGACVTVHQLNRENPDLRADMCNIPNLRAFLTAHGFLIPAQQRIDCLTQQICTAFRAELQSPVVCSNLPDLKRKLPDHLHRMHAVLDELQVLLRKQHIPLTSYLAAHGLIQIPGGRTD